MSCGLCDSSTYDSSSVSCATPREREAVIGERVLVVLEVLARASSSRDRRATARAARASASRSSCVGRAGIAMTERDVARARPAPIDSEMPTMRACIGSRLVVSVSNATSSAASMAAEPARERCLVAHRLVVHSARRRGGDAEDVRGVASQRRPAVSLRRALARSRRRHRRVAARRQVAQPALEFEALVHRAQARRRRLARCTRSVDLASATRNRSCTVSSRVPCGSHVERLAQILADDAADLVARAR